MPIEVFGGEARFEQTKINDFIKTNYCFNNNIILLRISYLENILEKLNEFFKLINNS